jgi:hypothetical protein
MFYITTNNASFFELIKEISILTDFLVDENKKRGMFVKAKKTTTNLRSGFRIFFCFVCFILNFFDSCSCCLSSYLVLFIFILDHVFYFIFVFSSLPNNLIPTAAIDVNMR